MKVYIRTNKNLPAVDWSFAAFIGADKMGMEYIFFEDIMEVPANRNNIVVSDIDDMVVFFNRLGINVPAPLDAYYLFRDNPIFIGRKHTYGTVGELKDGWMPYKPCFIKPSEEVKKVVSGVVKDANSLPLLFGQYDDDIEVLCAEYVDIVSEYRAFVSRKKGIVGLKHYLGDFFKYPSGQFVEDAANFLQGYTDMPACYSIDFGVTADGRTTVIECNDGWSLGSYGLEGDVYLRFLIERWLELMKQ